MSADDALWWATAAAFGTGLGVGSLVGWLVGDLIRRALRWAQERRA